MQAEICCILNLAPLYNAAIYRLMDSELKCDFYIGDRVYLPIKLMDYNELVGFKKILKNITLIYKFYWQKDALRLVFKPYKNYIIIGEPYCISTWLILIFARIAGKKIFLWTHGWYGNETIIKRMIKKIFFELSTKVLLYGDYAKDLMIKEGFSTKKLIPIYNSMDYQNQCKIRETLSVTSIYRKYFQNNFPVLLYIGRIQRNKKLDLLIEAMSLLSTRGINCNLIIIGEEAEKTNTGKLVDKYKLGKFIWFYGSCYDENTLGELIYNANLCVVPGDVGLTVMHSFVYGTPIVTHDNFSKHGPEFEAIREGITGSFFKEDSLNDLCDKISNWITISVDKRENIRHQCYNIINEKYNPYRQIELLKNILI
jgi:glycosyltransferase involved in cell wall biosynthesis